MPESYAGEAIMELVVTGWEALILAVVAVVVYESPLTAIWLATVFFLNIFFQLSDLSYKPYKHVTVLLKGYSVKPN